MEARIKEEIKGKKLSEIFELNLDSEKNEKLVGITDEFTALESLSLNNVGLKSLKGFPKLNNLRNLEIGDNQIKDGLEALNALTELTFLNLADNPIDGVDSLKPLGKNVNLKELDLFSVEVSIGKAKRDKIFKYIPSLKFLDGCDKDDKPKDEEDESDFSDEEEDGEEGEEEEENDIPLRDIYDKSLNETEEDDGDFESGEDEEEDDVDDELDEEENEEEEEGDNVANLSKESVDEPRTKKQKVKNGEANGEKKE